MANPVTAADTDAFAADTAKTFDLSDDSAKREALVAVLKEDARELALEEIADAVGMALEGFDGSLAEFTALSGLDKSHVSNIANGKQDVQVATLARIALALGKSLHISIR